MNAERSEQLEKLIDETSLAKVLAEIGEICQAKADHVSSNWQDRNLSRAWREAGDFVDAMSSYCKVQSVS